MRKNSYAGTQIWDLQNTSYALYQLCHRDFVTYVSENYLLKDFKNHAVYLAPVLALVKLLGFHNKKRLFVFNLVSNAFNGRWERG